MKRDIDLIRRIVLALQDQPPRHGDRFLQHELLADIDRHKLEDHILLVQEMDLAKIQWLERAGGVLGVTYARTDEPRPRLRREARDPRLSGVTGDQRVSRRSTRSTGLGWCCAAIAGALTLVTVLVAFAAHAALSRGWVS